MAYHPPPHLIDLLERTGLATGPQVRAQARRVARLARGLPSFDSLWLDGLVQARCLTPYQAAEIAAGRAEQLRIGPFVCCRPLVWPQYVRAYQARRVSDGSLAMLVVVDCPNHPEQPLFDQLCRLADRAPQLGSEHLAPIAEVCREAGRLWAAADWIDGVCAARLLTHHGRLDPVAALETIRQMVAGLVVLEEAGLCHGDLCAAGLMLDRNGRVVLPLPGLRPIVRPVEGYGRADLTPAAFDYLAPERVERGEPPSRASDIYACGCLWWHLLTGRPPLGGGDSLGKLRAAQQAAIPDVRRYAPATPDSLAAVLRACLARDPAQRPRSMAELAGMLGKPTARGALVVARQIDHRRSLLAVRCQRHLSHLRRNGTAAFWLAVATGCLLAAGAALWRGWDGTNSAWTPDSVPARAAQPAPGSPATPAGQCLGQQEPAPHAHAFPLSGDGAEGSARFEAGITPECEANVVSAEYRRELAARAAEPRSAGSPASGPHTLGIDRTHSAIVLRSERSPLRLESFDLQAGQHLCGQGPGRPVVLVPRGGLVVGVEGVRFENLAFCWQPREATEVLEGPGPQALIELRCASAEFRECTFSVLGASGPHRPAALAWRWPQSPGDVGSGEESVGLPAGRLRLENCVFSNVSVAVACRPAATLALELDNVLHVAPGPLVRLHGWPQADQPLLIRARRLTLRDCGPLVEADLTDEGPAGSIGPLQIEASASVFAPRASSPLIVLLGNPQGPEILARALRWSGQGSLVAEGVAVAAWGQTAEGVERLDEGGLAIAGLVRSRVEFAGTGLDEPSQSRVVGWQAPLTDSRAPGFHPGG